MREGQILLAELRESFRSSVRPGITWLLGGTVSATAVGMAFFGVEKEVGLAALAIVAGFFGQAMTFYFPQRQEEKAARFAQESQDKVNELLHEQAMKDVDADARAANGMGFFTGGPDTEAVPTEGKR